MKQNYVLFLMGILTVGNAAFSMEDPQWDQDFKAASEAMKQAKAANDDEALLKAYGKMADITIPAAGLLSDPHANARKAQNTVIQIMVDQAKKASTLEEALEIYKAAPKRFAKEIAELEAIPQQIKDIRAAYKKAQEEEKDEEWGDKENALIEYGKIADIVIPAPPSGGWFPTIFNPYSPEVAMQKTAISKIENAIKDLKSNQEKLEAYKKYAPKHFKDEITNLEKAIAGQETDETARAEEVFDKANKAVDEDNYTQAKQILQDYIATNPSATLKTRAETLLTGIEDQEAAPAKLIVTALQKLTNGLTQIKNKISKPA